MNSRRVLTIIAAFLCCSAPAFALQPDQLALIVNSNVPAGRELAELYARFRHVPEDRILELNLPTGDDISFDEFERTVVPQVREFLATGNLENKVTCLVTCFGVPLRMQAKVDTPAESRELAMLRADIQPTVTDLQKPVADLEAFAGSISTTFHPSAGMDFDHLAARADAAVKSINNSLAATTDPKLRAERVSQLYTLSIPLVGRLADLQHRALQQQMHPSTQPGVVTNLLADRDRFNRDKQSIDDLQQKRYDALARAKLRDLIKAQFGGFNYVRLLREQSDYLDSRDSTASFDSELALVRATAYTHTRWRPNPFNYQYPAKAIGTTLMVSRLDAPDAAGVKLMILTSLKVENDGLRGKVVVDSRGLFTGRVVPAQAAFATWDQYFRNFAHLVRSKTKLEVVSDDTPDNMPAHTADNVAIYTGWYSLRHYIPVCTFNPGAIGFHLASFEGISIHSPAETGWVHGLLSDGVVATLGPVAEPFLQSFPRPDEFFPLMMTGKFTLAEAYWRTVPMTSWMQTLVGDPLYNPYKNDAALKTEDLPDQLRTITPP